MNMVKATLYFILLEFMTVFAWFAIAVNLKSIINIMVSDENISTIAPQAVAVGQNVVTAMNVLFVVLLIAWACWYAYMAHALTYETTYQIYDQVRKF